MPRYDYDDDFDDFDDFRISRLRRRGPRETPYSGLGIVSFFMAIVIGIAMFILVMIATIFAIRQNGAPADNDPMMGVVGLGIIVGCGLSLVGLVLGIIGAMQPERRGLYGVLGSIFNGLILLGVGGLLCLGILAG